jgi:ribosomal-protein-alanine N-acetyltransferase
MSTEFLCLERNGLRLVPETLALARAEADGPPALALALGIPVPGDWPPPLSAESIPHTLRLLESAPAGFLWGKWFVVATDGPAAELVGIIGFKGPPVDGLVEIGYSVVTSRQGRGRATRAVALLLSWLGGTGAVSRVCAHTLPELAASIRVLKRNGFVPGGPATDPEPGAVRFERSLNPACPPSLPP